MSQPLFPATSRPADRQVLGRFRGFGARYAQRQVTGSGGVPVVGAVVQPRSLDNPPKAIPEMLVATDQSGSYQWSLQPGRYEITVIVPTDAATSAPREVTVRAGQNTTLDFP